MEVFIGGDHAGYELRQEIIQYLQKKQIKFTDCGSYNPESVDYPDYAFTVAKNVAQTPKAIGILVCGSGVGVDVCANKVKGIRSALVFNKEVAKLARNHDHANVISLAARYFSNKENIEFLEIFLNSNFDDGRHERRVKKIIAEEQKQMC